MLHIVDDLHARDIPDLPSLLPWDRSIDDGIIMTRRGGFMASYLVVGPDTMSVDPSEFDGIAERIHEWLMGVSEQNTWVIHSNVIRIPSTEYPSNNHFSSKLLQMIDEERREMFESEGQHFANRNIITLQYIPFGYLSDKEVDDFYFEGDSERLATRALQRFYEGLHAFEGIFQDFAVIRKLGVKPFHGFNLGPARFTYDVDEQLQFLYYCLNGIHQPIIAPPSGDCLSDYLMGEPQIATDEGILVGDRYASVITVRGFPPGMTPAFFASFTSTAPAMRLSTKAILLDRETSLKIAAERKSGLYMNLFNVKDYAKAALTKEEPDGRTDVRDKTDELDDIVTRIERNEIRLAIANWTIVLFNQDPVALRSDTRSLVEELKNDLGIIAYPEPPDVDATKRLVGSIPGDLLAGVGLPTITTEYVVGSLPISAIWAGIEIEPSPNYPPRSPALLRGKTVGATSFSLALHPNGENSTQVVVGQPRTGKTVFLNTELASFDRYLNSIGGVLDYGGGFETLGTALEDEGLAHYFRLAPGSKNGLQLAPLANVHKSPAHFLYGIQVIRLISLLQGKPFTKEMREHTTTAMRLVADESTSRGNRSMEFFWSQVQDNDVKSVAEEYLDNSPVGNMYNGSRDEFDDRPYLFFDMKPLEEVGDPAYIIPAYFHILHILLTRAVDRRPYLIILDEIWRAFVNVRPEVRDILLSFLIEIVRTLEKMNGTPILCLHAPEDIEADSDAKLEAFAALLKRAVATWIFLPIPRSVSDDQLESYKELGLSKRERSLLRNHMQRARDYYYVSAEGRRPFELELSDLAKAFLLSESRGDEKRQLLRELSQRPGWIPRYLEECGLAEYADIYKSIRTCPARRAS